MLLLQGWPQRTTQKPCLGLPFARVLGSSHSTRANTRDRLAQNDLR